MRIGQFERSLDYSIRMAIRKKGDINNFLKYFGRMFRKCTNEFEEIVVIERFSEAFKELEKVA